MPRSANGDGANGTGDDAWGGKGGDGAGDPTPTGGDVPGDAAALRTDGGFNGDGVGSDGGGPGDPEPRDGAGLGDAAGHDLGGDDGPAQAYRSSLAVCWTDASCTRVMAVGHGGLWNLSDALYDSNAAITAAYDGGMDGVKIATSASPPTTSRSSPTRATSSSTSPSTATTSASRT